MELSQLTAVSPIDGRYRRHTDALSPYFSEYGLIKYRVRVEIEYFIALCELPLPQLKDFDRKQFLNLRKIYMDFNERQAQQIKDIEKVTNHDVKAVEYFIKERFDKMGISEYQEFIHFGLTSQDINNTSVPLSIKECLEKELIKELQEVASLIESLGKSWMDVPMLARTHGQPASPTLLGKEFLVFYERLMNQMIQLNNVPFSAKFGGATGNFNAHHIAYPEVDWMAFANRFVEDKLTLHRSVYTTQIEHYDNLAALFDGISRLNTILIDFSRDIWQYISMNYFKQKIQKDEVGSSAMPHKVNPIDFENAEGNLGIANAIFHHLSAKLPISRLQRDLTDSTVLRNVGVPIGHTLIALRSLKKGIGKLELHRKAIDADLENNWAVVAEAIQTVLRREGYEKPYEALKSLTRNNDVITKDAISAFIDTLGVSDDVKSQLKNISPYNYTGITH